MSATGHNPGPSLAHMAMLSSGWFLPWEIPVVLVHIAPYLSWSSFWSAIHSYMNPSSWPYCNDPVDDDDATFNQTDAGTWTSVPVPPATTITSSGWLSSSPAVQQYLSLGSLLNAPLFIRLTFWYENSGNFTLQIAVHDNVSLVVIFVCAPPRVGISGLKSPLWDTALDGGTQLDRMRRVGDE